MSDVYIFYKGNGPITIPLAQRGAEYTFKHQCKNIVDAEVWDDLSKPGGPAFAFRSKFKRTSKPGPGDKSHRVTSVTTPPRTVPRTPEERASDQRDLVAAQAAEIARLREQLELVGQRQNVEPAGPADAKPTDEPEATAKETIDPSKLSVAKLTAALPDLDLDELDQVKKLEQAGKNRSGAIEAIEAAINKLLEAEDDAADEQGHEQD